MKLKEHTAKAVGYVVGGMPFIPTEKKIKIPGTGYHLIKLAPEWGKRHKILYRAYNSALTALLFLSPAIADGVGNTVALYKAGQHKLQHSTQAPRGAGIDRKAAENGLLTLAVYNVNFGEEDASHYSRSELEKYLDTAFGRLGIGINVEYLDVNPRQEWEVRLREVYTDEEMKTPKLQQKLQGFPAEFEKFVRNTEINKPLETPDEKFMNAGKPTTEPQLVVAIYLEDLLGSKFFEMPGTIVAGTSGIVNAPRADVSIVIADFKDGSASGTAHNYSNTVFGEPYVLVDKRHSNKTIDQKSLKALLAHETGHKIGLDHSSFWPLDVMSYAPISGWFIERVPQLAFGPESWFEWRGIKGHYTADERSANHNSQAIDSELDDKMFVQKSGLWVPANDSFTPAFEDGKSKTSLLIPNRGLERTLKLHPDLDTPVYRKTYLQQITQN
ncbi:hypothetical protein HYV85_06010 [Candidatus Woesearchaeota archaeon]|nr:hypothetical protein [Candidatus Woesearchaeota archaeon]